MNLPPAGWYPDPTDPARTRYWSGQQWTEYYAPATGAVPYAPVAAGAYGLATVDAGPYQPLRTLSKAIVVVLAVSVLVSVLTAFVSLDRASLVTDVIDNPRSVTLSEVQDADDRVQLANVLGLGAYLVTGIVWIVWFHRSYKNAARLGALDLRHSSGWAVGAWFVPFLNLARPKQIADDIWKSSTPSLPTHPNREWMAAPVSPLLNFWWALFIANGLLGWFTFRMGDESLSAIRTRDRVSAFGELVSIGAAILAAIVVRKMTARLDDRARALGVAT